MRSASRAGLARLHGGAGCGGPGQPPPDTGVRAGGKVGGGGSEALDSGTS